MIYFLTKFDKGNTVSAQFQSFIVEINYICMFSQYISGNVSEDSISFSV